MTILGPRKHSGFSFVRGLDRLVSSLPQPLLSTTSGPNFCEFRIYIRNSDNPTTLKKGKQEGWSDSPTNEYRTSTLEGFSRDKTRPPSKDKHATDPSVSGTALGSLAKVWPAPPSPMCRWKITGFIFVAKSTGVEVTFPQGGGEQRGFPNFRGGQSVEFPHI